MIAALADGRFAVAYTDHSRSSAFGFSDLSDSAVRVQVFSGDGSAAGAPVQVNTVATFHQQAPKIAPLADGGFVVTYSDLSHGYDSGYDDLWSSAVRMQRFTGDGLKLGLETLVNTTVFGDQDYPSVALLEDGRFLVAWDDGYSDVDENIRAQAYTADGTRTGGELLLNANTTGSQTGSDIAALAGGGFAVTWVDGSGADGSLGGIMARVFNPDGSGFNTDVQVNTTTTGDQYQPSIAALAGGGFVVVWTDNSRGVDTGGDDTSSYAVRGQIYHATGTPIGTEFRVNQITTYGQLQPDILALSDGRFIVAFSDTSMGLETGDDDPAFGAIRARIFHADGTPDGDEFLVNLTTHGHQNEPQMAELADGRVVFTWSDYSYGATTGGDDPDNGAIRARILDLRETALSWTGGEGGEHVGGTIWDDVLRGAGGNDHLDGSDGDDRLYGDDGNDWLSGDAGMDILKGHDGNDCLSGGDGDDTLVGNSGMDTLRGDGGNDRIKGGAGDDIVQGGAGADLMSGQAGSDVFVFVDSGDSGPSVETRDTITDFVPGTDLVDLRAIDANPWTLGDDDFIFLGHDYFTGSAGELRYSTGRTRSVVKIDLDGDRRPDMKIVLTDVHHLDSHDFLL